MYTNEQHMAWIMDTYSINVGHTVPSVVTGKPVSIGGSLGRTEATGRGVSYCVKRAVEHYGIKTGTPTVAIQGFGNVGSITAKLLHEAGFKIVAVSDVFGAIYNADGLDIPRLLAYVSEMGRVEGFTGSKSISNKELLETECDVLVPAALGGQITDQNADNLRCKIIVEGANGPTSPDADKILFDRGILVIPDILANAGGVTVSYFEWVQGMMHLFWSEDEVNRRLEEIMGRACDSVFEMSAKSGTSSPYGSSENRRFQNRRSQAAAWTVPITTVRTCKQKEDRSKGGPPFVYRFCPAIGMRFSPAGLFRYRNRQGVR